MLACRSSAAFQGRVHETSRDRPSREPGPVDQAPAAGRKGPGTKPPTGPDPPLPTKIQRDGQESSATVVTDCQLAFKLHSKIQNCQ